MQQLLLKTHDYVNSPLTANVNPTDNDVRTCNSNRSAKHTTYFFNRYFPNPSTQRQALAGDRSTGSILSGGFTCS